ncbi:hypothetical protein NECAME_16836 [Necator americanus]|uniref:Uncharacterized protein n=1 Tax=Necator americanus TaxID=51031 RepID=W2TU29_NECAM|nr:hypothetical protein NECAME_16836 [Necator americanus]ETN85278.1 hypothetical protein NECAME_16836 [Necator americanus]
MHSSFFCSVVITITGADDEFARWPWTAAVINNARPSTCGVVGQYATPIDLRTEDCYNLGTINA